MYVIIPQFFPLKHPAFALKDIPKTIRNVSMNDGFFYFFRKLSIRLKDRKT